METQRRSIDVVSDLLASMAFTVKNYHPTVGRTGGSLEKLIDGTSCFPGGTGLWRGGMNGGPLPEFFPIRPVMFVAHNFDSQRAFAESFTRRGEAGGQFWQRLVGVVRAASLKPEECFFTNALMGLKPGSATGSMPSVPGYKTECAAYLKRQIEIVGPRAVVALGVKAREYVSDLAVPCITMRHPSDWHFRETVSRDERINEEGAKLSAFLVSHS